MRAVEEPVLSVAEGTPAMLLADALQSFPDTKPERN